MPIVQPCVHWHIRDNRHVTSLDHADSSFCRRLQQCIPPSQPSSEQIMQATNPQPLSFREMHFSSLILNVRAGVQRASQANISRYYPLLSPPIHGHKTILHTRPPSPSEVPKAFPLPLLFRKCVLIANISISAASKGPSHVSRMNGNTATGFEQAEPKMSWSYSSSHDSATTASGHFRNRPRGSRDSAGARRSAIPSMAPESRWITKTRVDIR